MVPFYRGFFEEWSDRDGKMEGSEGGDGGWVFRVLSICDRAHLALFPVFDLVWDGKDTER